MKRLSRITKSTYRDGSISFYQYSLQDHSLLINFSASKLPYIQGHYLLSANMLSKKNDNGIPAGSNAIAITFYNNGIAKRIASFENNLLEGIAEDYGYKGNIDYRALFHKNRKEVYCKYDKYGKVESCENEIYINRNKIDFVMNNTQANLRKICEQKIEYFLPSARQENAMECSLKKEK